MIFLKLSGMNERFPVKAPEENKEYENLERAAILLPERTGDILWIRKNTILNGIK